MQGLFYPGWIGGPYRYYFKFQQIGLQVFGKKSFNKLVVRQYEAFVDLAISLYLLECKKVRDVLIPSFVRLIKNV